MIDTVEVTQAYKFALDPTPAQAAALASHCGAARFAFNTELAVVMATLDQRAAEKTYGVATENLTPLIGWSAYSLQRDFNTRKSVLAPRWAENSKEAYAGGCANLARALINWSNSRKGSRGGERVGFPRFKSKHRTTPSCTFTTGPIRVEADRKHVTLPKLGTIRTHESTRKLARRLGAGTARLGAATVSFHGGRWFVSFIAHIHRVLARPEHVKAGARVVGVDVGVKDLLVVATPDGREVERILAPAHLKSGLRELRQLQRKAARQHGPWDPATRTRREASGGWRNTQDRIRAQHIRIANLRRDHLHKTTTRLAHTHQVIGVETLAAKNMARRPAPKPDPDRPGQFLPNRRRAKAGLNRGLADASFGELLRLLNYKTRWYGSTTVKAERFYPSSKTCSGCGSVKTKLALSERSYTCTTCGIEVDRDLNAAINLARLAAAAREHSTTAGSVSVATGGAPHQTRLSAKPAPAPAHGNETRTQPGDSDAAGGNAASKEMAACG